MELTKAAADVLAERNRQIAAEGWTPEHDDAHSKGEMAVAAGYYALWCGYPHERECRVPTYWPWDAKWWKPRDKRRNLVKAAALTLAEIERLDRAEAAPGTPSWLCPNCPTPGLCQSIQGCDRDEIAR